jgi:hypothetical protein
MTNNSESTGHRTTELSDAAHVIESFGGIRPAASLLGVAVSTVQGWKERGVIPQNREQVITDVAALHGIDLAGDKTESSKSSSAVRASPMPDDHDSSAAKSRTAPPVKQPSSASTKTKRSSGSVAWVALAVAGTALIAVISQPNWAPVLFPESSREAKLPPPIAALLSSDIIANLENHIAAVEVRLAGLSTRIEAAELLPDVSPLNERIASLVLASGNESNAGEMAADLSALANRMAALEGQLSGESIGSDAAAEIASLRAGILALSVEVAAWSTRLEALETVPTSQGGAAAALVLAIGQLDAAIRTGGPFASALDRVRTIGEGDFIVAGALAQLTVWAEDGIPTIGDLRLRFRPFVRALMQPGEVDAARVGWWPRVRSRLAGFVTVRRIGEGDDLSPIAQIELAVERGDLAVGVAALEERAASDSEAIQSWLIHAKARLAAEAALTSLGAHTLDELKRIGMATP